jgi:hypothetical protein
MDSRDQRKITEDYIRSSRPATAASRLAEQEAKRAEAKRPKLGPRTKTMARDLQQLAVHSRLLDRFGGIRIDHEHGTVRQGDQTIPLAGAHATVETSGQIDKRVTMTRFILTGLLAFAIRKKKDDRQLYVTVEGDTGMLLAKVHPRREKEARQFCARLNTAARRTTPS